MGKYLVSSFYLVHICKSSVVCPGFEVSWDTAAVIDAVSKKRISFAMPFHLRIIEIHLTQSLFGDAIILECSWMIKNEYENEFI